MSRNLILPGLSFLNNTGDVSNLDIKDVHFMNDTHPKHGQKVLAMAADGTITSGIYLNFSVIDKIELLRLRSINLYGEEDDWEEYAQDDLEDFEGAEGLLVGPEDLFSTSIYLWTEFPKEKETAERKFKNILNANILKQPKNYRWGKTYPDIIDSQTFEKLFIMK